MHYASREGRLRIVQHLLEAGTCPKGASALARHARRASVLRTMVHAAWLRQPPGPAMYLQAHAMRVCGCRAALCRCAGGCGNNTGASHKPAQSSVHGPGRRRASAVRLSSGRAADPPDSSGRPCPVPYMSSYSCRPRSGSWACLRFALRQAVNWRVRLQAGARSVVLRAGCRWRDGAAQSRQAGWHSSASGARPGAPRHVLILRAASALRAAWRPGPYSHRCSERCRDVTVHQR